MYYKTTFTITVLSEEPIGDCRSLSQIDNAIMDGPCVGGDLTANQTELTGSEVANELYRLGSEPGFFNLDDKGNKVEEDC